jgi:hypothetical protein
MTSLAFSVFAIVFAGSFMAISCRNSTLFTIILQESTPCSTKLAEDARFSNIDALKSALVPR